MAVEEVLFTFGKKKTKSLEYCPGPFGEEHLKKDVDISFYFGFLLLSSPLFDLGLELDSFRM